MSAAFTVRAQVELLALLAAEEAAKFQVAMAGRTGGRGQWRTNVVIPPQAAHPAVVRRVCLTRKRKWL